MNEIIFVVEEAPEDGFTARAVGESIFAQTEDAAGLHVVVRDAVRCHFEEGSMPGLMKVGAMEAVLADVAAHLELSRDELVESLFG